MRLLSEGAAVLLSPAGTCLAAGRAGAANEQRHQVAALRCQRGPVRQQRGRVAAQRSLASDSSRHTRALRASDCRFKAAQGAGRQTGGRAIDGAAQQLAQTLAVPLPAAQRAELEAARQPHPASHHMPVSPVSAPLRATLKRHGATA